MDSSVIDGVNTEQNTTAAVPPNCCSPTSMGTEKTPCFVDVNENHIDAPSTAASSHPADKVLLKASRAQGAKTAKKNLLKQYLSDIREIFARHAQQSDASSSTRVGTVEALERAIDLLRNSIDMQPPKRISENAKDASFQAPSQLTTVLKRNANFESFTGDTALNKGLRFRVGLSVEAKPVVTVCCHDEAESSKAEPHLESFLQSLIDQSFLDLISSCDREFAERWLNNKSTTSSAKFLCVRLQSELSRFALQCSRPWTLCFADDVESTSKDVATILAVPAVSAYEISSAKMQNFGTFYTRHNARCKIVEADPQIVHYLGYLPQELLGRSFLFLYASPDDFDIVKDAHMQAVHEYSGEATDVIKVRRSCKISTCNRADSVDVETEFALSVNPWSMCVEFIFAKHTVLSAPSDIRSAFEEARSDAANIEDKAKEIEAHIEATLSKALTNQNQRRKRQPLLVEHGNLAIPKDENDGALNGLAATMPALNGAAVLRSSKSNRTGTTTPMKRGSLSSAMIGAEALPKQKRRDWSASALMDQLVEDLARGKTDAGPITASAAPVLFSIGPLHQGLVKKADVSPQSIGEISSGSPPDSSGSGPTYSQINYADNIRRYFDSQPKTHSSDESTPPSVEKMAQPSKSCSPEEPQATDLRKITSRSVTTTNPNVTISLMHRSSSMPGVHPDDALLERLSSSQSAAMLQQQLTAESVRQHTASAERAYVQTWKRRRRSLEVEYCPILPKRHHLSSVVSASDGSGGAPLQVNVTQTSLPPPLPLQQTSSSFFPRTSSGRPSMPPFMVFSQAYGGAADLSASSLMSLPLNPDVQLAVQRINDTASTSVNPLNCHVSPISPCNSNRSAQLQVADSGRLSRFSTASEQLLSFASGAAHRSAFAPLSLRQPKGGSPRTPTAGFGTTPPSTAVTPPSFHLQQHAVDQQPVNLSMRQSAARSVIQQALLATLNSPPAPPPCWDGRASQMHPQQQQHWTPPDGRRSPMRPAQESAAMLEWCRMRDQQQLQLQAPSPSIDELFLHQRQQFSSSAENLNRADQFLQQFAMMQQQRRCDASPLLLAERSAVKEATTALMLLEEG